MLLQITSDIMLQGGETKTDTIVDFSYLSGEVRKGNTVYIYGVIYRSLSDMQAGRASLGIDNVWANGQSYLVVSYNITDYTAINASGIVDFCLGKLKDNLVALGCTVTEI